VWDDTTVILKGTEKCYGPCSSVGIATDYGLDGPGIESHWNMRRGAEDSNHAE
jgi:hypothetical protein